MEKEPYGWGHTPIPEGSTDAQRAAEDEEFQHAVWMRVRLKLIPQPWQGNGEPPADGNEPGNTIRDLNRRNNSNPDDTKAKRLRDELLAKLIEETAGQLRQIQSRGGDIWTAPLEQVQIHSFATGNRPY